MGFGKKNNGDSQQKYAGIAANVSGDNNVVKGAIVKLVNNVSGLSDEQREQLKGELIGEFDKRLSIAFENIKRIYENGNVQLAGKSDDLKACVQSGIDNIMREVVSVKGDLASVDDLRTEVGGWFAKLDDKLKKLDRIAESGQDIASGIDELKKQNDDENQLLQTLLSNFADNAQNTQKILQQQDAIIQNQDAMRREMAQTNASIKELREMLANLMKSGTIERSVANELEKAASCIEKADDQNDSIAQNSAEEREAHADRPSQTPLQKGKEKAEKEDLPKALTDDLEELFQTTLRRAVEGFCKNVHKYLIGAFWQAPGCKKINDANIVMQIGALVGLQQKVLGGEKLLGSNTIGNRVKKEKQRIAAIAQNGNFVEATKQAIKAANEIEKWLFEAYHIHKQEAM